MSFLSMRSWSPWVVGAAIGMLSWFSFATVDKPIGITTAFEYTAALTTRAVAPGTAQTNPYYSAPENSPKINWEWMLVLGVFAGAFASSKLSGDRPRAAVPARWARTVRNLRGQAIHQRVHRRRIADDRRTTCRRLHERAWDQRRSSARRFELGVPDHHLHLRCDCRDRFIREARRFPCLSHCPTCCSVY